ncbi:shikimate kinase [Winogradskyella marincola]|uniref:Shikimate kinase n=1 Tax=Winogradskyella marincola TaxID=3037795 RepID=A0ABT6FWU8_9FLAO|nr:shikimate kinase [Winogradskyella sp. YYF002]MDG4714262.1 shikimate kinase [Winogradskyella sp. YYF002]
MIVALMGYMGSGKSTIGKNLATVLNYNFLDLDEYISEQENCSIPELFKNKGEIYFRKKETQYLNEVLSTKDNLVLALGGGTPCYGNNINILLDNSNVNLFYLKLSIPNLVLRLFKEKDSRPLISHLTTKEELTEFIGKHLFERTQYYNQASNIITSDNKSKKDILEEIVKALI